MHRVAVLHPFTRFLAEVGAPVEREIRQAGLPWCALEDADNYVPSHGYWKFLACSARAEGIEDLGFRVGEKFGANYIIDVLRGSRSQKVLGFKHDQLSTYGIGKEYTKKEWHHLSRQLLSIHVICITISISTQKHFNGIFRYL